MATLKNMNIIKSNEAGQLYITTNNFKLLPTITQSGTCTYNGAPVIAQYLKPSMKNIKYLYLIMNNTQKFPKLHKQHLTLLSRKECISYDLSYISYADYP